MYRANRQFFVLTEHTCNPARKRMLAAVGMKARSVKKHDVRSTRTSEARRRIVGATASRQFFGVRKRSVQEGYFHVLPDNSLACAKLSALLPE